MVETSLGILWTSKGIGRQQVGNPPETFEKAKKEHKMAKNQNVRLTTVKMQADLDSYTAWQGITTYAPANTAYAKTAVTAKYTGLKSAHTA